MCVGLPSALSSHLFNQFFLMISQMVRQLHVVSNDEVAEGTIATVIAFATQPDFRTALCQRLYLQFDFLST